MDLVSVVSISANVRMNTQTTNTKGDRQGIVRAPSTLWVSFFTKQAKVATMMTSRVHSACRLIQHNACGWSKAIYGDPLSI